MKIIWSPLAIEKASEIADYISFDNPTAAQKWVDSVFQKIESLQLSPKIDRIVPEIERKEIRELIFGNYRIIYHLENTRISILTIRHERQILPIDEIPL